MSVVGVFSVLEACCVRIHTPRGRIAGVGRSTGACTGRLDTWKPTG